MCVRLVNDNPHPPGTKPHHEWKRAVKLWGEPPSAKVDPKRTEWFTKVQEKTFLELKAALAKDRELRKADPKAILKNFTYSVNYERYFLKNLARRGLKLAALILGGWLLYKTDVIRLAIARL